MRSNSIMPLHCRQGNGNSIIFRRAGAVGPASTILRRGAVSSNRPVSLRRRKSRGRAASTARTDADAGARGPRRTAAAESGGRRRAAEREAQGFSSVTSFQLSNASFRFRATDVSTRLRRRTSARNQVRRTAARRRGPPRGVAIRMARRPRGRKRKHSLSRGGAGANATD